MSAQEPKSQAVVTGQRGMATIEAMLDMSLDKLVAMSDAEILEYLKPALEVQPRMVLEAGSGSVNAAIKQATRIRVINHINLEADTGSDKVARALARRETKVAERKQSMMDLAARTMARGKALATPTNKENKHLVALKDLASELGMEDELEKSGLKSKLTKL